MTLSLLIDFDGTIVRDDVPGDFVAMDRAIETLRDLKAAGHQLVLWTCRDGWTLKEAVDWCASQGIEFDAVNAEALSPAGQCGSMKPIATVHIDDRNLGGFPGWGVVRELLLGFDP